MINRRNIRTKVLQAVFAMHLSHADNLPQQQKQLFLSFDNIYKLYMLLLLLLLALKKKALAEINIGLNKNFPSDTDLNPNYKFVNNAIFKILEDNSALRDYKKRHKLNKWDLDKELVSIVWQKIKTGKLNRFYMDDKTSSFMDDKNYILDLYKNHIAPEIKLHESFEADESHWADDIAIANTLVMKTITAFKEVNGAADLPTLFKDEIDREFAKDLFLKTVLNDAKLNALLEGKTPNWSFDRISEIDKLIMKMALVEFLHFPSIPATVSINEYVEIAKEYSTPKSNVFINGVLHNLYNDLNEKGEIKKNIRGRS